jgi:hypothetical protein
MQKDRLRVITMRQLDFSTEAVRLKMLSMRYALTKHAYLRNQGYLAARKGID